MRWLELKRMKCYPECFLNTEKKKKMSYRSTVLLQWQEFRVNGVKITESVWHASSFKLPVNLQRCWTTLKPNIGLWIQALALIHRSCVEVTKDLSVHAVESVSNSWKWNLILKIKPLICNWNLLQLCGHKLLYNVSLRVLCEFPIYIHILYIYISTLFHKAS